MVPISCMPICAATSRPLASSMRSNEAEIESDSMIASLSPASNPVERRSKFTAFVSVTFGRIIQLNRI